MGVIGRADVVCLKGVCRLPLYAIFTTSLCVKCTGALSVEKSHVWMPLGGSLSMIMAVFTG